MQASGCPVMYGIKVVSTTPLQLNQWLIRIYWSIEVFLDVIKLERIRLRLVRSDGGWYMVA